jgi:hypothetical protein
MRKQVEPLEHEADAAALARKLALLRWTKAAVLPLDASDRLAFEIDEACARALEMANAAQQCCLARARCANYDDCFAARDVKIDRAQHSLIGECFGQAARGQHQIAGVGAGCHQKTGMRRSSRRDNEERVLMRT